MATTQSANANAGRAVMVGLVVVGSGWRNRRPRIEACSKGRAAKVQRSAFPGRVDETGKGGSKAQRGGRRPEAAAARMARRVSPNERRREQIARVRDTRLIARGGGCLAGERST